MRGLNRLLSTSCRMTMGYKRDIYGNKEIPLNGYGPLLLGALIGAVIGTVLFFIYG